MPSGVGSVGLAGTSASSGVVMSVAWLSASAVVDAWESAAGVDVPDSETALSVLSSRRMLITGTSSAVLTNFSSMLGGRPFVTMRSAFLMRIARSLVCDMRYIVSSPASTVSQRSRIFFSSMPFSVGYCERRLRQCRDGAESLSV